MKVDYGNNPALGSGTSDASDPPAATFGNPPAASQHQQTPPESSEATPATPQADPDQVTLSRSEYGALLARIEAERARASAPKQPQTPDDRIAALESRLRDAARSSAIGDAVRGMTFVNDQAKADALALLAHETEVIDAAGGPTIVYKPAGIPLDKVDPGTLRSRLGHMVKAENAGGAGSTIRTGAPGEGADRPQTKGHALLEEYARRNPNHGRHPALGPSN